MSVELNRTYPQRWLAGGAWGSNKGQSWPTSHQAPPWLPPSSGN